MPTIIAFMQSYGKRRDMDMKLVEAQFETARVIIDRLETLAGCWGVQYEKKSEGSKPVGDSRIKVVNGRRTIHIDDLDPSELTGMPVKTKSGE